MTMSLSSTLKLAAPNVLMFEPSAVLGCATFLSDSTFPVCWKVTLKIAVTFAPVSGNACTWIGCPMAPVNFTLMSSRGSAIPLVLKSCPGPCRGLWIEIGLGFGRPAVVAVDFGWQHWHCFNTRRRQLQKGRRSLLWPSVLLFWLLSTLRLQFLLLFDKLNSFQATISIWLLHWKCLSLCWWLSTSLPCLWCLVCHSTLTFSPGRWNRTPSCCLPIAWTWKCWL